MFITFNIVEDKMTQGNRSVILLRYETSYENDRVVCVDSVQP